MITFWSTRGEYGFMSNWYKCNFECGYQYSSMEQYMMHQKSLLFGDVKMAAKIMETSSVRQCKAYGRKVSNFDDTIWNGVKQIIVYNGLLSKFEQHEKLKKKLLDTGDEIIIEASPKDMIWGAGLDADDPDILDMSKWKGQNLLGFTLMQVREELRRRESAS